MERGRRSSHEEVRRARGADVRSQDALTLLRMLRLLRLVKVFKLISFGPLKQVLRNINMTDDGVFTMDTFIKVCKYLGPLLYLGHLFGCFFFCTFYILPIPPPSHRCRAYHHAA